MKERPRQCLAGAAEVSCA